MNPLIKYITSFKLLYLIGGGLFFYLLGVLIDSVFIPDLDLPDSFCHNWIETRSGYQKRTECVEFSSKLVELKYRHNQKMEQRRANKMIGLFIAASLLTFLLMILNPSLFFGSEVRIENYTGAIATAVFYGIILGFILPTIFQLILPPPADWLPAEFSEIRKSRIEFILTEINKMAK